MMGTVFVKYDDMSAYAKPGFNSNLIEKINKSTELQALTETTNWIRVQTPSGKQG
jgi:hypothetical protein